LTPPDAIRRRILSGGATEDDMMRIPGFRVASEIEQKDAENVDRFINKARDMKRPWPAQATNKVKQRFGRLSKVIWQGKQWAVTSYGLERRDGGYHIAKRDLWTNDDANWGGLIGHVGRKLNVDIDDFTEALRIARCVHDPR
jgi:hypothetical protein